MSCLMIMAGGTGGHVYPAIAVANELRDRGVEIVWLGTREGLEARAVPAAGYPIEWISIRGLRGKGLMRWITLPWSLARALGQTLGAIRRRRPDAMLGMGGFVSGPGALAARLVARPLVIHEQNAIGGLTNRIMRLFASRVLTGFPDTFSGATVVGNPVRREFSDVADATKAPLDAARSLQVLVVGGSQGALALNRIVPQAMAALDITERPTMRHQSGRDRAQSVRERYSELGVDATVDEFIDDMAGAYADADLVICRAGAMTVAEVAASGVAAVFIPYPYAVSDHQSANARYLVSRNAAISLDESTLDGPQLAQVLRELNQNRDRLASMATAARAAANLNATSEMADICMEVLHA